VALYQPTAHVKLEIAFVDDWSEYRASVFPMSCRPRLPGFFEMTPGVSSL
jgi:hypothetical protein